MKYALALEGGGTKGSYHAGAFKALEELNIEIEAIVGTSIGSINGACFIQNGWEILYKYWEEMEPSKLIPSKYKELMNVLNSGGHKNYLNLLKELKEIVKDHGLDISVMKESIYNLIDEDEIRKSSINYGLVTFSLTEMKAVEVMINEISKGKLLEYVLASAYLPVFKREKLSGKNFIDGAVYDNLPINLLIKHRYKNIIAIELDAIGFKRKAKKKGFEITYISPSEKTGGTIDFSKEVSDKNLKMGYFDTYKSLTVLYGKWYYLNSIWSPEEAYNAINSLNKEQVYKIADILSIKKIPYKRCLYEKIIPKIMEISDMPEFIDYNMFLLYLIEFVAKKLEIDRFRFLIFTELVELVRKKIQYYYKDSSDFGGNIIKAFKTTKLYNFTFKDELLISCVHLILTEKGGENEL